MNNEKTTIQVTKGDLEIIKEFKAKIGCPTLGDAIVCAISRVNDKLGAVDRIKLVNIMNDLDVVKDKIEELIE